MNMPEPITELQAQAIRLHEMFVAYKDAGFTSDQAMEIILTILAEGLNNQ